MVLGLLSRFMPRWLAELLLGLVAIGALVGGGYRWGWSSRDTTAELAMLRAQNEAAAHLQEANARSDQLAASLADAQIQTQQLYQKLTAEVSHVVTVYRPAPRAPVSALPGCVFTAGFVRVWNAALDPGMPAAAGVDAATAAEADLAPSAVGQADVLNNHLANRSQDEAVRQQCDALIQWHRSIGGKR